MWCARFVSHRSIYPPVSFARAGDFQVQTRGQVYGQSDFEKIPLVTGPDGTKILVGDVARVIDGFADTSVYTRFGGARAVLIARINQLRAQGLDVVEALTRAGVDRFRPIILTSLTTFIGLVPIMLDDSMQARFLIPMVVALAFGILFATSVTSLCCLCRRFIWPARN